METEHNATKQGSNDDLQNEINALQKSMDEMKTYYEGKVRQVEESWEKNRQEFDAFEIPWNYIEIIDEYKFEISTVCLLKR